MAGADDTFDLAAARAYFLDVQSRIVATAELFFAFVPRHRFAADLRDEVLESYLSKTPPSDPPPATGTPHAH